MGDPRRRTAAPDMLDPIHKAIAEIAAGRPVVVVDDEDRENEGDLIFAAELATPELIAFMVRTTQDKRGTAYTVTVDAREGVSTGISASDRCHTIKLLADPGTTSADLAR